MCFVVESEVKSLQSTFEHVRTKMYSIVRLLTTNLALNGIFTVYKKFQKNDRNSYR